MKNLNKRLGINENYSSYHVVTMDCLKPQHAYIFSIDKDYGVHIFQETNYKAEEIRFVKLEELEFIKIYTYRPTVALNLYFLVATFLFFIFGNIEGTIFGIPSWGILLIVPSMLYIFSLIVVAKTMKLTTKKNEVFKCQYTTSPLSKKKWREYKELKNKVKIINSQCTI